MIIIFVHVLNVTIATSWIIYIVFKFSYRGHYIDSRKQEIYRQFKISVIRTIYTISFYLLAMIVIGSTCTVSVQNFLGDSTLILVKIMAIGVCVLSFSLHRLAFESIRKMVALGIEASRKNKKKKPDVSGDLTKASKPVQSLLKNADGLKYEYVTSPAEKPVERKLNLVEKEESNREHGIGSSPTVLMPRN